MKCECKKLPRPTPTIHEKWVNISSTFYKMWSNICLILLGRVHILLISLLHILRNVDGIPRQISRFLHQTTFSELWFSPIFYKKWDQLFRGTFRSKKSLCSLCSTRLNQKYIRKKSYLINPCKSVSSVVKNLSRSTRSNQSLLTAALFRPTFHEKWDEPSPTPIKHTHIHFS